MESSCWDVDAGRSRDEQAAFCQYGYVDDRLSMGHHWPLESDFEASHQTPSTQSTSSTLDPLSLYTVDELYPSFDSWSMYTEVQAVDATGDRFDDGIAAPRYESSETSEGIRSLEYCLLFESKQNEQQLLLSPVENQSHASYANDGGLTHFSQSASPPGQRCVRSTLTFGRTKS
ncbi:hypothetical protein NX059_003997 [Plenodomus lindquistii]|nr:hypothetical protein NX059_003997 [Plenodomus lindquistii]